MNEVVKRVHGQNLHVLVGFSTSLIGYVGLSILACEILTSTFFVNADCMYNYTLWGDMNIHSLVKVDVSLLLTSSRITRTKKYHNNTKQTVKACDRCRKRCPRILIALLIKTLVYKLYEEHLFANNWYLQNLQHNKFKWKWSN